MKSWKSIPLIIICVSINFGLYAQVQTLTLQPGPSEGKDALIRDDFASSNFGEDVNFTSNAWTVGGNPCVLRSLVFFDLSAIPVSATVISAKLSLYCNLTSGIYQLQYGDNASYLLRMTQDWNENTVTWMNQPGTSNSGKVLILSSTSQTQDYPDIDVTVPVQGMVSDPSSNFGWMIQLVTEELYRSMVFASSDNSDAERRPKLVVEYHSCPGPVARFDYKIEMPVVSFYDSSSSATSWYWNFGDGYYSDLQDPAYEYGNPGKYYVCLNIEDSCGTDEYCDTVYACEPPDTKFSYSADDHFVDFTDLSLEASSWYWSFGDGFFSDLKDPLHYYNGYGDYYVCLTSENMCRQNTWCDSVKVMPDGIRDNTRNCFKFYPNPARDFITVSVEQEYLRFPLSIEIVDQLAIVRKKETVPPYSNSCKIDVSDLSQGMYCIRCVSDRFVMAGNFLIY